MDIQDVKQLALFEGLFEGVISYHFYADDPELKAAIERGEKHNPPEMRGRVKGNDHRKELIARIERLNLEGFGVFMCINGLEEGSKGRSKEKVVHLRASFVDIDKLPENTTLPDVIAEMEKHNLMPTIITGREDESKLHLLWVYPEIEQGGRIAGGDGAKWTELQKKLAVMFGGDVKVCDLPRVLRVPGTLNHKGGLTNPVKHKVLFEGMERVEAVRLIDAVGGVELPARSSGDGIKKADKEVAYRFVEDEANQQKAYERILAKVESAIEGKGGDGDTYLAAAICHDQGLTRAAAAAVLTRWNDEGHCIPKWSKEGILQKVDNAYNHSVGELGNARADVMLENAEDCTAVTPEGIVGENGEKFWIYSVGDESFYHAKGLRRLSKNQFSDVYRSGFKPNSNVANIAIHGGAVDMVDQPVYLPGRKERVVIKSGRKMVNLWRPSDIIPERLTPEQQAVVQDRFVGHLKWMLAVDDGWKHLLGYLAYLVQCPGEKVLWMPVIQGPQGIGKSFIGAVMRGVLGSWNVSMPSNDTVHEKYTGWLESSQLVIIEEIMATGRRDLMNKFKPIITESLIEVRRMHKDAYQMENRTNLLAFTNYEDSIALDSDDRRYCFLDAGYGEDGREGKPRGGDYYDALFTWSTSKEGLRCIAGYLRYHVDLGHGVNGLGFEPKKPAPMTEAKQGALETSRSHYESIILQARDARKPPFHTDFFWCDDVCIEVENRLRKIVTPRKAANILAALGYVMIGRFRLRDEDEIQKAVYVHRLHPKLGLYRQAGNETLKKWYQEQDKKNGILG